MSLSQKSLLLNAGLQFVEYNAISINSTGFKIPSGIFDALIFTSQNGVHAYLEHLRSSSSPKLKKPKAFCVGEKTKTLLQESGFEVLAMAHDAKALGEIITGNFSHLNFLWPTGSKRREELPKLLKKEKISYTELTVYKTDANLKKFDGTFDGILFFSPSGVKSFVEMNTISGTAFCIGKTTAETVKKYTDNYIIANTPTVENVLVQAVKQLKSNSPFEGG